MSEFLENFLQVWAVLGFIVLVVLLPFSAAFVVADLQIEKRWTLRAKLSAWYLGAVVILAPIFIALGMS